MRLRRRGRRALVPGLSSHQTSSFYRRSSSVRQQPRRNRFAGWCEYLKLADGAVEVGAEEAFARVKRTGARDWDNEAIGRLTWTSSETIGGEIIRDLEALLFVWREGLSLRGVVRAEGRCATTAVNEAGSR
jgi:hypothetical protein